MGSQTGRRSNSSEEKNYFAILGKDSKSLSRKWAFKAQSKIIWEKISDYYPWGWKAQE